MEKITLRFSGHCVFSLFHAYPTVVLVIDEAGKHYSFEENEFGLLLKDYRVSMDTCLPKRILKAFTASAIDKILSKDEIPNESGWVVEDGHAYTIKITKGEITKEYNADDASIETYPLLRYLASWYKHL